ncbi:hypothetical protein C0682_05070 [Lactiplantibacillus plantarum]|nr:hypothetical protein C0682_05070 [Lactiplantibacillus plantarum]
MYAGLDQIQDKEFDVFTALLNIFNKNKLRYFVTGGTVLGANFYQNFIPYDDDIDVALVREDYNKFIEMANYKFNPNKPGIFQWQSVDDVFLMVVD